MPDMSKNFAIEVAAPLDPLGQLLENQ